MRPTPETRPTRPAFPTAVDSVAAPAFGRAPIAFVPPEAERLRFAQARALRHDAPDQVGRQNRLSLD